MADLLTDDDLEALAQSVRQGADPAAVVAALVAAVDEERLADAEDEAYALALASDIAEEQGDLEGASAHARRAASATGADGYLRAAHARLLLLTGRDAEGLAILDDLRPALVTDYLLADGVFDALQDSGRTAQAVQWSTEALDQAYPRWVALAGEPDSPGHHQAAMVAFRLTARRRDLRRELGLPADESDGRVDALQSAVSRLGSEDEFDEDDAVLAIFWPQADFDRLIGLAPELSTVFGSTWDEHRDKVEAAMAMLSATGVPTLGLMEASVDELVAFAAARDGRITDDALRDEYVGTIEEIQAWPPPTNLPCWCGSGAKYKRCCLPRSRMAHV